MSNDESTCLEVIRWLEKVDAKAGLGKNLYETISRLTPSVSIELIIKSSDKQSTLLTWRDDDLYGPGWHVPGGVLRFKETFVERASKTLEDELQIKEASFSGPIGFHEIFNDHRDVRGHFISVVFETTLNVAPRKDLQATNTPSRGSWRWFETCPQNLIKNQAKLRKYI